MIELADELVAMTETTPTLYEWAGGTEAFVRLTDAFYARVVTDDLLGPLFAGMSPEHARAVAIWLAEVFGGPATYSKEHGGYPHMVAKHLGLAITEPQRRRWVNLIQDAADEAGLPDDPEFRAAFLGYLEWAPGWPGTTRSPARKWPALPRSRTGAGELHRPTSLDKRERARRARPAEANRPPQFHAAANFGLRAP